MSNDDYRLLARELYQLNVERLKLTTRAQVDYGKWLIATLAAVHSAGLYAVATHSPAFPRAMAYGSLGGQVVRETVPPGVEPKWRASINARELRPFASRDEAMCFVERELVIAMKSLLEDWNLYQSYRAKRATGLLIQ